MFIDNRLTCMHYHSDGRRQDGRTFGRTNERKENIQTNSHKQYHTKICIQADGRTHGRTDTYRDNIRTGSQTDGQKHTQNCIPHTNGWTDRLSNRRTVRQTFYPHAHRHSHTHAKIKFSWSKRNSANQCLMKSFAQLNYVVRSTYLIVRTS